MVGGMESAPKVTAAGILELWKRPDQLAAVRADLEKNVPIAMEEIVRYCAPAQYTFRTAHKDVTVAGQHVKAGQRVACLLHSASRDEREFAEPDSFIWNRPIERVLSFGLGQHHCIGKHLAKLEVRTLVHEFLAQVDSFEVVDGRGRAKSQLFPTRLDQPARHRQGLVLELRPIRFGDVDLVRPQYSTFDASLRSGRRAASSLERSASVRNKGKLQK